MCAASNKENLAFKTTLIEDTHLTLIGILSKVEANNSLLFLLLQAYEKKFAEFPFLFISIIPCFMVVANTAKDDVDEWCVLHVQSNVGTK